MGRPSVYEKKIEPYLKDIEKWSCFMTEEQIAKTLGVGCTTFRKYKKEFPMLTEAIKKGRRELVAELKSTLIKKAQGYKYEEKTIIKFRDTSEDGTGELVPFKEEVKVKYAQPDVAAINLLLKNYDREFWRNDPAEDARKNKELELKEKKLELEEW